MSTPVSQLKSKIPTHLRLTCLAHERDSPETKRSIMEARSSPNYATSPLLKLPAEIRREIFKYVFSDLTLTISPTSKARMLWPKPSTEPIRAQLAYVDDDGRSVAVQHPLALLPTSAQLYQETSLLLFELATFDTVRLDPYRPTTFVKYLEGLSERQRSTVSTLRFDNRYLSEARRFGLLWLQFDDSSLPSAEPEALELEKALAHIPNAIKDLLSGLNRVVVQTIAQEEDHLDDSEERQERDNEFFCEWLRSFMPGIEIVGSVEILPAKRYRLRYEDDLAVALGKVDDDPCIDGEPRSGWFIELVGFIFFVAMGAGMYWALRSAT